MATKLQLLTLFLVLGHTVSGLELINGAYENFVIKVAEDVPSTECKNILENLETALSSASQYLFSALNGRAFLRSATVLLPASWPDACTDRLRPAAGEPVDMTVVARGQTRGRLWTQQSLGCGQPGDQIYLGYDGLLARDHTLARSLVKEFAMYRFGVFEEQGYYNDPIYPMCFYDDETKSAKVTGCSDFPINDNGVCSDIKAPYNTTQMVDEKARSSIMFAAEAPAISMFCDEGNHDRIAPTKHNLLCQRHSVLDVIWNHKDFAESNSANLETKQITDTTPKITYKKHNVTRYVFVIDNTKDMMVRESWNYLRLALRQWVTDNLNENSEVGLVLTDDNYAKRIVDIISLKSNKLDDPNRQLFYSSIPFTSADTMHATCLHCALRNASQMLNRRTKSHGSATNVIVVIGPGMDGHQQLANVLKDVKKAKIRIATINYPTLTRSQPLDTLAEQTNGAAFTIFEQKLNIDTTKLTTYFELHNVLYNIVQLFDASSDSYLPMEIHRREITNDGRTSVTGSFMIDAKMGEPAQFTFFTHNTVTPLIKSLKLISPSHQVYDRWNDKNLHLKMLLIDANMSEAGTWTYTVEPYSGNPQPHFLQVLASPKEAGSPAVRCRFWTHRNQPDAPLVLLTEVKYGDQPVLAAKVEVTVAKSDKDGTVVNKNRFELLDTGSGDPDITKGDGVYTRYFSPEWGPGVYTFEVVVTDNGNTAYSWSELYKATDDKPCCGSIISPQGVQPITPFQRYLPKITKIISSDDITAEALVSAGRIGDLRSEVLPGDLKARLVWTAPDMGGRSVSSYEIRYSFKVQDIIDRFETDAVVWEDAKIFPLAPGSETTCTLDFGQNRDLLDKPLFMAVKSFAKTSNSSAGTLSNYVRVFVAAPAPPPTAPPSYSSSANEQSYWPSNQPNNVDVDHVNPTLARTMSLGLELILPIAIGFILLVILLILYCYFCVIKKRGKTHKKAVHKQQPPIKNDNNLTIVPTTPQNTATLPAYTPNELADPHVVGVPVNNYAYEDETKKRYSLVHQQEQQLIEELKQQQMQRDQLNSTYGGGVSVISNTTLPRGGHTLSPYNSWSASQLLHEHERRHSPMEQHIITDDQVVLTDALAYTGMNVDHMSLNGHHMAMGVVQVPEHYVQGHVPPPVPPLPSVSPNGYPVNYSIYGTHPNGQIAQQIYQSVPRSQEVVGPYNTSLQGSMSSVNSAEKKRRNVTMV